MKSQQKKYQSVAAKKRYQQPCVQNIHIDTEVSLSMVSVPPNPWNSPQMPQSPEGLVQKVFKLR